MSHFFVIRKRGTNLYFPSITAKGSTYLDPVSITKHPPRLFMSRVAASNCLTYWVKGKLRRDKEGYLRRQRVDTRRRADFEIVPVTVRVIAEGS